MKSILAIVSTLFIATATTFGFGSNGHVFIGAVAFDSLSPDASAAVKKILKMKGARAKHVKTIRTAATWPDDIKVSGSHRGKFADLPEGTLFNDAFDGNKDWHFVDYPLEGHYTLADAHYSKDHDIVHMIGHCIDVLEGTAGLPWKNMTDKEALAWLVHLVGDLHQPLHCGVGFFNTNASPVKLITDPATAFQFLSDNGGNNLHFTASSGLHSFWDNDMVDAVAHNGNLFSQVKTKAQTIPANTGNHHDWPVKWASETIHASLDVYSVADLHTFSLDPIRPEIIRVIKEPAYKANHVPLALTQLGKGAADLRDLLNAIHYK